MVEAGVGWVGGSCKAGGLPTTAPLESPSVTVTVPPVELLLLALPPRLMPAVTSTVSLSPSVVDSTEASPPLPPPPPTDCATMACEPSPTVVTELPPVRVTLTAPPAPPLPPVPPTAPWKLKATGTPVPVGAATTRSAALELPPLPPPPPIDWATMPKASSGA